MPAAIQAKGWHRKRAGRRTVEVEAFLLVIGICNYGKMRSMALANTGLTFFFVTGRVLKHHVQKFSEIGPGSLPRYIMADPW